MKSFCKRMAVGAAIGLVLLVSLSAQDQDSARRQEESEDYFRRWLEEDVAYIITDDEKGVFSKLTTDDEREQFIEQFWYRRDPDLRTAVNEFKQEHYRRLAYVQERFTSGVPGWKTDRGRIYIIHGPPTEIESHRSGESYQRPSHEGGGFTSVHPFEIWRYRNLEGIGQDVELEFVDPTGSGEFRLALTPWEKDRLLVVPGTGLTDAESTGLATRARHPYFSPYTRDTYGMMSHRAKDDPFTRYETLAKVQRPQAVKYKDLKELVEVRIGYQTLPLRVGQSYFRLSGQRVLAPVTFEVENRNLTFKKENGLYVARVAVYGIVTSITNRVVSEFDDDLQVSYPPEGLAQGQLGRSLYQKIFTLEGKLRYRLDLVVKDLNSGSVGAVRQALSPPDFPEDRLSASPLVVSDSVRPLPEDADFDEMFVVGDLKIRPNLSSRFSGERPLGVYFHLYNAALDQSTGLPALTVRYRIRRDGKQVKYWSEENGESIHFLSPERIALLRGLPVEGLPAADYRLEVQVQDRLSGEELTLAQDFALAPADSGATTGK